MKILQLSGGVDSLACLLLLKGEPDLMVLSVLTDGAYESSIEYLFKLQAEFAGVKFVTFQTERKLPEYGQPVDVVPLRWTALGQLSRGSQDTRYQDAFSCCHRAIWEPLDKISRGLGATTIFRGQRNDDRLRSPMNDGDVDRGVTLRFPIATWTRQRVLAFIDRTAPHLMPPGYDEGEKTSRDCWDCTAYLGDNMHRIANLPPEQNKRLTSLIARWRDDVATEMELP
jgi:3'-phosphoadenosine 5'-phosphosulfate sulfotransferase (PAPS reductase)/FAD synthetase